MKKVIICEKPSLARFAASCLGKRETFEAKKMNGATYTNYYESNHYIITCAIGHLFEAYDVVDYTKDDGEWKLDILPFCPPNNHFYFKLHQSRNKKTGKKETNPDYKRQYDTIFQLINRSDVNGIIHYGDAGREGEIIIRQIVRNANSSNKPMIRLWVNAMVQSEFDAAFNNMLDDKEYDAYANEGDARLKMDWLYGINLTIYLSIKAGAPKGKPFHAGRVVCGMLNEIYKRELEIENFVPEKYLAICSKEETMGSEISMRLKEKYSMDDYEGAVAVCAILNEVGAVVSDIKTDRKKVGAGKLFSTTTLQNRMSTKYKIEISETEHLMQSLYEKGYITYPRTGTEYLPEGEKEMAQKLITLFREQGYELVLKNSKMIFDSSKVADHGALCPTTKMPSNDLTAEEQLVYDTIKNRFLAVFCQEDCLVDKSVMTITCADQVFTVSGSILVQKGYLKYEENTKKDTILPSLKVGDRVNVNFCPVEEETKPPSRYSEATFNDFLENPFAKEAVESDDEKYASMMQGVEIGTVASRTDIIKKMLTDNYISIKNNIYYLMPAGRYLIDTMKALDIEMTKEKTVELSVLLKKVFNGELTENDVIEYTKEDLQYMFRNRNLDIRSCVEEGVIREKGFSGEPLGECPICGSNVYETRNGFLCENASFEPDSPCKFYIKKDNINAYFKKVTGNVIKPTTLSSMLKYGYVPVKTKTKNRTEYETLIRFKLREDDTIGFEVNPVIGKCPVCHQNVVATPFGYKCSNENCFYVIFRKDKFLMSFQHKEISIRQAMTILSKGAITLTLEKKDKSAKYKMKFTQNIDRINRKVTWTNDFVQSNRGKK